MTDRPEPGNYVHYKNGKHYKVIDVVRHSETEEWMVLYAPNMATLVFG